MPWIDDPPEMFDELALRLVKGMMEERFDRRTANAEFPGKAIELIRCDGGESLISKKVIMDIFFAPFPEEEK